MASLSPVGRELLELPRELREFREFHEFREFREFRELRELREFRDLRVARCGCSTVGEDERWEGGKERLRHKDRERRAAQS